uniref:Uncharacterized protein n=1 Tax=Setaria italica TaxID=4555 RepID=K3Y418_SETIT
MGLGVVHSRIQQFDPTFQIAHDILVPVSVIQL